ncbi:M56 family metallopeptidase [Brevundimonas variabilis]|uniref:Beta-lactamase regulating signal transducer with metallopeptidase domain n=1 Tax=Brevundimonas variabilis TaxID=74312 RepID=A0A7W9CK38_9CAUL|nr:M56 family metallopeptidase [Brevundimonas variabilis]MBB5747155.1 beta-lactamase regulating signal transducer with metallopeptidase domain [Brevundimonas variabilis]
MSPVELVALSLGASIAVSTLAGLAAAGLERLCADPALRERVWAVALYLPLLPPVVVGGVLLTPAPVRVLPVATVPTEVIVSAPDSLSVVDPVVVVLSPDWGLIAGFALVLAVVLSGVRLASLGWRGARLQRLIKRAVAAPAQTVAAVAGAAGEIDVPVPVVRISIQSPDALLTGVVRPLLILPEVLSGAPDSPAACAVIRHELAHLKRGDHRAVWLEEGLLALLAFNPVLPVIRSRRAAAREEACDAVALTGADAPARRAYAQSLIDALRARTIPMLAVPALTFTGSPRSQAMRRLKSIMTPPARAGRGMRIVAVSIGVALVGLAGAASIAVAGQRPNRVVEADRADVASSIPDHAYFTAAMDPIYKVAWPEACGFGSSEGEVFVQIGEGCSAEGGPHALIQTLEGVNPKTDPAGAFAAVQSACTAGRPVRIAFSRAGVEGVKTATCANLPAVPATPVRFTVDIGYDPAISIAPGDRLEIALDRDLGTEGTASTGMEFDLAPGALPNQAFADLMPPLLPPDRSVPMFTMSARIIDRNGVIKAVSDRDLGRSHAPYLVRADAIRTKLQLVSMADPGTAAEDAAQTAREAARTAAAAARAALGPDQRARDDAARTGVGFKALCSEKDAFAVGYCNGVMFGAALRNVGGAICLPEGIDYGVMAGRAQTLLATETVYPGEEAVEIATRVIAKAYPCGSAQASVLPTRFFINGSPMPAGLPHWGLAASRVEIQDAREGRAAIMNFIVPQEGSAPVFLNGVALPAGVGLNAVRTDRIVNRETASDGSTRVRIAPRDRSTDGSRSAVPS